MAKTELQDLGEEEDAYTESTSKMRDKILALTKFDILEEDGQTFKSIYDILLGVGKAWENLTDLEKASLSETMAGKVQSNVLFSVLNNSKDLEKAYKTAMESNGSAEKEQENWEQSIEASVLKFKANIQDLAQDLINSQWIKEIVDLGTTVIQLIDKFIEKSETLGISLAGLFAVSSASEFTWAKNLIDYIKIIGSSATETAAGAEDAKKALLALGKSSIAVTAVLATATVVYELATANAELAEKSRELAYANSQAESSLDGYKSKVSELYNIIDSEDSTYEQQYQARQELYDIQNKLVEQYGKEAQGINLVTDATVENIAATQQQIEKLKEVQWHQSQDEFNLNEGVKGFWQRILNSANQVDTNEERLVKKFEQASKKVNLGNVKNVDQNFLNQALKQKNVTSQIDDTFGNMELVITGNANDVYETLKNIQNIANNLDLSGMEQKFSSAAASIKKNVIDEYSDYYNQYMFNDVIMQNDSMRDKYKELTDAYNEYTEAINSGNQQEVEKYSNDISDIYSDIINNSDEAWTASVKDWFEQLYPQLQNEISKWKFETEIQANVKINDNEKIKNSNFDGTYNLEFFNDAVNSGLIDASAAGNNPVVIGTKKNPAIWLDFDVEGTAVEQVETLQKLYDLAIKHKLKTTANNFKKKILEIEQENKDVDFNLEPDILSLDDALTKLYAEYATSTVEDFINYQSTATESSKALIENLLNRYGITIQDLAEQLQDKGLQTQTRQKFNEFSLEKYGATDAADDYTSDFTDAQLRQWMEITKEETNADRAFIKFITHQEQAAKEATLSPMVENVVEMSNGLGILSDVYEDVLNGGDFNWDNLSKKKFEEAFNGIDGYDEFIESVAESPGDITAAQKAFDKMVSAYIKGKVHLDDFNESSATLLENYLKQQGVLNADEIVDDISSRAYEHQNAMQEYTDFLNSFVNEETGDGLLDLDYAKWADEYGKATDEVKAKLISLIETEKITKADSLDNQITEYRNLANALGIEIKEPDKNEIKKLYAADLGVSIDEANDRIRHGGQKEWQEYYNKAILEGLTEGFNKAKSDLTSQPWEIHAEYQFNTPNTSSTISEIQKFTDGFEIMGKMYKDVQDGEGFDFTNLIDPKFVETFSKYEDEYNKFISDVSANSNDISKVQDAFDGLITSWIYGEVNAGRLNAADEKIVASMLEMMGVANAAEVATSLFGNAEAEAAVEAEILSEKQRLEAISTEDATKSIYDNVNALIAEAGESKTAQIALIDLITQQNIFNNSSLDVSQKIAALNSLAAQAIAAGSAIAGVLQMESEEKLQTEYARALSAGTHEGLSFEQYKNQRFTQAATQIGSSLKNLVLKDTPETPITYSGNPSDSGSGGSGSDKATEKELEFIQRKIDNITRARQKLDDVIQDENVAYDTQVDLVDEALTKTDELIEANKAAAAIYQKEADSYEAQIREQFKSAMSGDEIESMIQGFKEGSVDQENWKLEFEVDDTGITSDMESLLDKFKQFLEGAESFADAAEQEERERINRMLKRYEIMINKLKGELSEIQTAADNINSSIQLRETAGQDIIKEADYRNLIQNADEQIDLQEQILDQLYEELNVVEAGSSKWYSLKSEISSVNSEINGLIINQAEWNEEIKQLPIKRVQRYVELLQDIKKLVTNFRNEQEQLGIGVTPEELKLQFDNDVDQIHAYQEEVEKLKKNLGTYTYGTDKFNETANAISDCTDNISQLIVEMEEYNNQLLNLPMDNINKALEELQRVMEALQAIEADDENTVNAVITRIDEEKDRINKAYDERIEKLNDENEAQEAQLAVEKARLNLIKLADQKTAKVLQNGEFRWKEDIQAVKDASDDLAEKVKQKQIADLEAERDKIIDALDETAEKWRILIETIENNINYNSASEIFGDSDWQSKVLTGSDDALYQMIKAELTTTKDQIHQSESQQKEYERISALMAVYVDQFQTGKMSYEDMMRHYSDLINSTSEGFTSQEYLQGVLDAYDKTSVSSSLLNLDSRVEGFYADFGKYLTAANDNMAVIQSMRSTLEQIAANVAVYTEQLKKAKEEDERKAATQLTTPTKSRSSNSGGGGSVITAYGITFANEDDRNYFLSLSAEERAANVAANHTGYMWIDPTSSEFDDKDKYTIYDAKAHRSGAEGGFIGNEKSSRASDTVRTLALEPLDSDGVLAQLHLKELVLNPNQMGTLYGNMRRAVSAVAPGAAINNYAPNNTFSFGDITITEAQNVTDIAAGIMNGGLAQAITQELYKR